MKSLAKKTFRNSFQLVLLWSVCTLISAFIGSNAFAQEISWTGAGDGISWEDPNNWNPTSVPSLDADVSIIANLGEAYTIVLSSDISINSLNLSISQATLDLQAALTIAATMNQTAGRVSGVGDLVVQGVLTWRGGRMEGNATTFLNGGAEITGGAGSSGNNKIVDGRRMVVPNGEVFTFNGSLFTGQNGALIEIQEGGLFDLVTNSSSNIMRVGTGGATIVNAGTISKSQGTTSQINIEWDLENSGLLSMSHQDATLQWQGGLTDNGGQYIVELGFLDLDIRASADPYVFTPDSRLLAGPGARINLGSSDGDGSETLYELQGTVEMDGIFSIKNFNGGTTANVTIPATANLVSLGGELLLVGARRGRLFVEVTDPVSVGDLIVGSSGRLQLGSLLTVTGDYTQNNSSAVIASDFDVTVQEQLSWSGGRMEGSGTTFLNGGAEITGGAGSSGNNKIVDGRRMVVPNGEVFTFNGSLFTGQNGALIEIQEGGLFDLVTNSSSNIMRVGTGGATIVNAGTISKSQGTTSQINIEWDLENSGTFEIAQEEGDLKFPNSFINTGIVNLNHQSAVIDNTQPIQNSGIIHGVGIIRNDVNNISGTVMPGLDASNTGTLTIQGSYSQSEKGTLAIKVGGTEPDAEFDILVTGSSSLLGTIELVKINDFVFAENDQISPLIWSEGNQTGSFSTVNDDAFPGIRLLPDYTANELVLRNSPLALPQQVTLISPSDGATGISISPDLSWDPVDNIDSYHVQVSRDDGFSELVADQLDNNVIPLQIEGLDFETTYFWRVRGVNDTGEGEWSSTWRFATKERVLIPLFSGGCIEQEVSVERVIRNCVGEIDFNKLSTLLEPGNTDLQFSLYDGEIIAIASESNVEIWSDSEFSWFGKFTSSNNQDIVLEVDLEAERAFAIMTYNNRSYRLEYFEENKHAIYEVDLRGLIDEPNDVEDFVDDILPDKEDPFQQLDAPKSKVDLQRTPVAASSNHNEPVIDLLILYTQQAKNSAGGKQQMLAEIRNAVNMTNSTFRNSGINARVRLSSAWSIAYSETGNSKDDLSNLRISGESNSYTANYLKRISGADIVGLIVSDIDDACGRAYRMDDVSTSFRNKAYFVVGENICLGNTLAFPHEIGHIMAARHDWRVTDGSGSPYLYNHGYVNPPSNWSIPKSDSLDASKQWMTVMAYNDTCKDVGEECYRIWNWSNPKATFLGDPLGNDSDLFLSDNVRTLNNTAATVAAFSDAPPAVYGYIMDIKTGLPLSGVEVLANSSITTTNEGGFYEFVFSEGTDLVITPILQNYQFQPESSQLTNITDDVQIDFDAFPLYTIQGRVTENGVPIENIEIRGSSLIERPLTNANGEYKLVRPYGWSGSLIPYSTSYTFTPEMREYTELSNSQANQDYTAELNTYMISGVIRDLTTGNFVSDVKLDGFPKEIHTNEGGFYSIELDHGWSGFVQPVKEGFNFEPVIREYTKLVSDRTDDYDAFSGWLARSSWPMFMANPQHTGTANVQTSSDRVHWEHQFDSAIKSPVIGSDETIYIATEEGRFYIVDSSGQLTNTSANSILYSGSPAISSSNILFIPLEDFFLRLPVTVSGIGLASRILNEQNGYFTSPVINPENGMAYIGSNSGYIYALNSDDLLKWSFMTTGSVRSSPALSHDGTIYVGSNDDHLYALRPDGTQKWKFATGGDVRSSPSIGNDGTVYIGSDDGYLYAISFSGSLKWKFKTGGQVRSTPAIDSNGNLYIGSDDGLFYAIDNTGQLLWSYSTGGSIKSSAAISQSKVRLFSESLDEEVVYIGSEDGFLYAFSIIGPTGITSSPLLWKYDFGSPVNTSPILSSDGLIAGSDNGKLIAFKQVSRAWTQGIVLVQDDVPTQEDLAIMIWLDQIGGSPGLIGGNPGFDPCQGGPLIIPNCEYGSGLIGDSSPFLPVLADEKLIIGLARTSSDLTSIFAGETTDGLLKTFSTTLPSYDTTSLFFAGLTETEGYAQNPDGLNVELQMFTKYGFDQIEALQPEETAVYAGHFSTDSPAMNVNLSGPVNKTFSSMRYGDISEIESLPTGNYQVSLELQNSIGKISSNEDLTFELDLTGTAGEPVAILIEGFLNPEENKNGPSLALRTVTNEGSMPTSTEMSDRPVRVSLNDNYPNPFNPSTSIPFDLKESGAVRIDIYNITGQRVKTLVDGILGSGSHVISFDASSLASGVYIYRMITDNFTESKKMILIK